MSSGANRRAMHEALAKRFSPTAVYNHAPATPVAGQDLAAAAPSQPAANAAAGPNEANAAPGSANGAAGNAPGNGGTPAGAGNGDGANGAGNGGGDGGLAGFFSSLFNPDPTTTPLGVKTSAPVTPPVKPTSSPTLLKSTSIASSVISTPSSSSSSSSSSTSSSSSSVSSSPSSVIIPTTSTVTGTAAVETRTTKITSSAPQITPSPTSHNAAAASPTTSSSMSKGEKVGAIAAVVLVVIVALVGAIYFVRRCRSRHDEDDHFDPNAFRGQSIALPDDTPSPMARIPSYGRGSPRPPTMIERKFNNVSTQPGFPAQPMFVGQQYGQEQYGQNPYGAYGQANMYNDFPHQQAPPMPSFQPGQIIFSPETPTPRAMTFSPPPMHGASPIAPPQPVAFQDGQAELVRRSSAGSQTSLTRKNSNGSNHGANPFESNEDAHYVDLNRSSVTPFQAAQYVEISRRIGSAPPTPLFESAEEGQAGQSPFADESDAQEITVPTIAVVSERAPRIQSTPPVLPDVVQRPFSAVVISPGPTTGFGAPSAPSHLRVSTQPMFDINAPKIDDFDLPPSAAPTATQFAPRGAAGVRRPETVYDEDDAYGGM